jgi:REP element-mobilizing transposase RayT
MSFTKIMVHAVWGTKRRYPFMSKEIRPLIIDHINTNAVSKGIYIDSINGFTDHLHCLMDMHQEYSIGKSIQLLKGESAHWINKEKLTSSKFEWSDEYYAVSVDAQNIIQTRMYILGQEAHHQKVSFQQEYNELMKGFGY